MLRVGIRETDESQQMQCQLSFRLQDKSKEVLYKDLQVYEMRGPYRSKIQFILVEQSA